MKSKEDKYSGPGRVIEFDSPYGNDPTHMPEKRIKKSYDWIVLAERFVAKSREG
jgi:hypothetical protein